MVEIEGKGRWKGVGGLGRRRVKGKGGRQEKNSKNPSGRDKGRANGKGIPIQYQV